MISFHKYHGLGNDFVLIDLRSTDLFSDPAWLARSLCDRRFGIGADGLLLLQRPPTSACRARMRIFNPDGSEAEMCGNGLRCLARHVREHEGPPDAFLIDTAAGAKSCRIVSSLPGSHWRAAVSMGRPLLERSEIPMKGHGRCVRAPLGIKETTWQVTALSMGNPHAVVFLDDPDHDPMEAALEYGPALQAHPDFPNNVNASFVRPLGRSRFRAVVWERGAGLTLACGTGASAVAVAALLEERADPGTQLQIELPGGSLELTVLPDLSDVWMEGPAALSFSGEVDPEMIEQGPKISLERPEAG